MGFWKMGESKEAIVAGLGTGFRWIGTGLQGKFFEFSRKPSRSLWCNQVVLDDTIQTKVAKKALVTCDSLSERAIERQKHILRLTSELEKLEADLGALGSSLQD